jgi:tetratricopeptide (TPR) repeat protein
MLPPTKIETSRLLKQAVAADNADLMLQAGAAALQSGAQAEALSPVSEMLRRDVGNARLWQLLGLLNRDLQDSAAALEAFRKAAQLMPNDAMIANGLACVTHEAGLPATELFERAIDLDPTNRDLWLRLSASWAQEGQAQAVIGVLEEELGIRPSPSSAGRAATDRGSPAASTKRCRPVRATRRFGSPTSRPLRTTICTSERSKSFTAQGRLSARFLNSMARRR